MTSTDLDRHERGAQPVDLLAAGGGIAAAANSSAVVQWAQRLTVVAAAVDLVIETPFVPASFWPLPRLNGAALKLKDWPLPWLMHPNESPEDYGHRRRIAGATATLAALHGEKYGWQPEQSWRLLYAQNGRVSLYYEGVGALLRGAGYRIVVVERTETLSVIALFDPAGHRSDWEFTMDEAIRAGYVKGKGPNTGSDAWRGNDKYNTDPKTMLYARNLTRAARIEAPHVIAGMPIVELDDDEPRDVGPEPATGVTSRVTAQQIAAQPHAGDVGAGLAAVLERAERVPAEQARVEQPQPAPDAATDAQLRKLGAVFTDLGVKGAGERAERLRIAGEVVGRPLSSSRELTKREAQTLIDTLEGGSPEYLAELLVPPPPDDATEDADDGEDSGDELPIPGDEQ
jgi:hypothetical protein